jgi:hypothetical protein
MPEYGWNTTAGLLHLVQVWLAMIFIFYSTLSGNSILFNFFWWLKNMTPILQALVLIGLPESVKSVFMAALLPVLLADRG